MICILDDITVHIDIAILTCIFYFFKFDAEFRRVSVQREGVTYDDFYKNIEEVHGLQKVPFLVTYTDPEGDLLPINNDDNFQKALSTARPGIRLCIQRKGMEGMYTFRQIEDLPFLICT